MFKVTLNKVTLSVPFRMEEIAVCNVHNYNGIDKKIDVIIEKNTETAGEAKLEYQYFISMIRSGEFNTSFAEKEVNNKRYTIRQSYVAHIDNDPTNVEFGYVPFIQYESPTPSLRNMEGRFPCLLLKLEWARMGIYEYTHYKVDSNEGLIINKNANDKIYSIDEACKILSIARSSLLNFIKSDKISSITIERKRKIPHAEIVRILVNGLPSFKHKDVGIITNINLDDCILNKNEYFTIHYNDYMDGYYHDDQIKARLRHDWKEYLRDIFGIDNSKSKDYVYSCYRRWYARERARLLKLCKGDSKLLKELMKMRHEAILAAYESKGYKLHDCSSPSYRNNREAKIEYAIEYYEDNIHKIRTRLRNKYKSGSYEKRRYDRR